MPFNPSQIEKRPTEAQIRDCAEQLRSKGKSNYGESVQKYAQLRLADLAPLLADWQNEAYAAALNQPTLPKIAAAILLGYPSCVLLATANYQWQRDNDGETVRYLAMWHGSYLWLALLIATSLAKNGRAACKQHLILLLAAFTLYRLSA